MIGSSTRPLLFATLGWLGVALGVAQAQQRTVIVRDQGAMAGVQVGGSGVGSAMTVTGTGGMRGVVIDSQGRVQRFQSASPAVGPGQAVGAFAGNGSTGIVSGSFDPFEFVFGRRGMPTPGFSTRGSAPNVIDLDAVEIALRQGDYAQASQRAEDASRLLPGDPEIQQQHALALFALGRYPEAGRIVRDALRQGGLWDWASLRRFYNSNDVYLDHYRALRAEAATFPESADTMLLLAYHELILGRIDAARQATRQTLNLRPDDRVARDLLAALPPVLDPPVAQ